MASPLWRWKTHFEKASPTAKKWAVEQRQAFLKDVRELRAKAGEPRFTADVPILERWLKGYKVADWKYDALEAAGIISREEARNSVCITS